MASKTKFTCNRMTFDNQEAFIKSGRRCGTAIPNDLQLDRVAAELSEFRRAGVREVEQATINVQFIHITDGDDGVITEQQRADQIDVLNAAYNAEGITFAYDPATVVEVDNAAWFNMGHRSQAERQAKTALHVDPETNLNFYTGALQGGLLGWATFPFDLAGDPDMDGVVMLHSSLPGGSSEPYNLGATAVHEIGHWLGLYHTFEPRGTCDLVNDRVEDTPNHANPDFGKPAPGSVIACDGVTPTPVKNYMNYTDDAWMDHFTPGQAQRMRDQIGLYRSGFVAAAPAPVAASAELKLEANATGTLTGTGEERVFSIDLPGNATATLDGPGGVDFDLYVKKDSAPTTDDYDQRSYTPGPDETLQITTAGRHFFMARSYQGAGNFTLKIALD